MSIWIFFLYVLYSLSLVFHIIVHVFMIHSASEGPLYLNIPGGGGGGEEMGGKGDLASLCGVADEDEDDDERRTG